MLISPFFGDYGGYRYYYGRNPEINDSIKTDLNGLLQGYPKSQCALV